MLLIVGTRPEAIKIAPLLLAARRSNSGLAFEAVITGQHGNVAIDALQSFGLSPDHVLDCVRPTGGLPELLGVLVTALGELIHRERPAAIVVQGDTSSALAGALAGFYERVPVVHLEAGLLTSTVRAPFPEEAHRRVITNIAHLHLAPTLGAAMNLFGRGIEPIDVVITGNTVVDAVHHVLEDRAAAPPPNVAAAVAAHQRLVVVTAHRRESWGQPMEEIGRALVALANAHPDVLIVVVRHPNPHVEQTMAGHLGASERIICIDPLPYPQFINLLANACLVLTDSGGMQEELPSLGVRAVVLRDETERPEAVHAGSAALSGTDSRRIIQLASEALSAGPVVLSGNPFGDGEAGRRSVEAIAWMLGKGFRPHDHAPPVGPEVSIDELWLDPVFLRTPRSPA